MDDESVKNILATLGMAEKEVLVYLALLKIGASSVARIAESAGVKRSNTYVVLEELTKKGFVSKTREYDKTLHVAAPPEHILRHLEESATKATALAQQARKILPQLKTTSEIPKNRPRVHFYKGTEGIKSVYEDTLTSHEKIRAFASIDAMHEALPGYFPEYYARRAGRDIAERAILPDTSEAQERAKKNKAEKRETKLVPKNKFKSGQGVTVYGNKVAFTSFKEKFGLIIESEDIANSLKELFDLAWDGSKSSK